jgi:hypothetical protein
LFGGKPTRLQCLISVDVKPQLLRVLKDVHRRLPSPVRHFGVGSRQICPGNLQIRDGLPVGFVLGMQKRQRFGLVLRAQTDLFPGRRVFGVKSSGSPKQDES